MKKVSKITPPVLSAPVRKKVAAYARVSMDSERLMHSLSAQISYYSDLIQRNPEWEYAGVFADEAVSGTGTERRGEFNRMLAESEAGNIQIILTKSISRFARNTVDLLETVRHLRDIGVEVRFEKENINSMSGDGELMLSILASFAQEESRSISENVKWAVRKGFEKGKPNSFCLYGYRWDGEQFRIVPEEAAVVRLIFENYLNGLSDEQTARQLEEMGVKSYTGGRMCSGSIRAILKNEKYTGNMLLQKCFIEDHISHRVVRNRGELPMYYAENTHPAIISKETFDAVQREMERRRELGRIALPNVSSSCFTGMVWCECCSAHYNRKSCGRKHTGSYKVWRCSARDKKGKAHCASSDLPEYKLKEAAVAVLGLKEFDGDIFRERVEFVGVPEKNELTFHLVDGSTIPYHWDSTGYADAWTDERRQRRSEYMKVENARRKEAKRDGKGNSDSGDN